MNAEKKAQEFVEIISKRYSDLLDEALKISASDEEFGEMQKMVFEQFRDFLSNHIGFSPLAASNFVRLLIHLWKPEQSPYTQEQISAIRGIIEQELIAKRA